MQSRVLTRADLQRLQLYGERCGNRPVHLQEAVNMGNAYKE